MTDLTRDEARRILRAGSYTTLAMTDGNDPYILSLHYGLDPRDGALYFYTTKDGMKLDFLRSNPYVCGTVIEERHDQKGKQQRSYLSVVYRGIMEVIHDREERRKALDCIRNQTGGTPFLANASDAMVLKLQPEDMEGRCQPSPDLI